MNTELDIYMDVMFCWLIYGSASKALKLMFQLIARYSYGKKVFPTFLRLLVGDPLHLNLFTLQRL